MIDASHLGLVDVGSWRLHTSDRTKVNSPYQRYVVVPGLSRMSPAELSRVRIEVRMPQEMVVNQHEGARDVTE